MESRAGEGRRQNHLMAGDSIGNDIMTSDILSILYVLTLVLIPVVQIVFLIAACRKKNAHLKTLPETNRGSRPILYNILIALSAILLLWGTLELNSFFEIRSTWASYMAFDLNGDGQVAGNELTETAKLWKKLADDAEKMSSVLNFTFFISSLMFYFPGLLILLYIIDIFIAKRKKNTPPPDEQAVT